MGSGESHSPLTYAERFHKEFPTYLSMGMTPEQYWDGDPTLCQDYRKAQELKNDRRNQELWLQGMYIYEALVDVAPIYHAFAKKGTKPAPYPEKPYALTVKARKDEKKEQAKKMTMKARQYMEARMASINQRFHQEEQIDT